MIVKNVKALSWTGLFAHPVEPPLAICVQIAVILKAWKCTDRSLSSFVQTLGFRGRMWND